VGWVGLGLRKWSVRDGEVSRYDIGWNTSTIISRLVSLGCSSFVVYTPHHGSTPKGNFGRHSGGCAKVASGVRKSVISLKRDKIVGLRFPIPYAVSIGSKINDLG